MRHQHFCLSGILIALTVAGAGACRSEIEAVSSPDMPSGPVGRELSVQASVENHVVKAEMSAEGLQTQFSEGDRISLFLEMTDGQVQEIPFSATGTTPSGCTFVPPAYLHVMAEDGASVYAAFPFQGTSYHDGMDMTVADWGEDGPLTKAEADWTGTRKVHIAPEQTQGAACDYTRLADYLILSAEPATVRGGEANLVFSPVTAQINVQLRNGTGTVLTVDHVTLAAASEPDVAMAGEFTLDMTASPKIANPAFALVPERSRVTNAVTLSFPSPITLAAGGVAELYFVVNAFSASSLTLTVFTAGGRYIIRKEFDADKRAFTRAVRRHLAFSATASTYAADTDFNDPEVARHVEGEPYDTYRGLVMAGYQGWQTCENDGSLAGALTTPDKWGHYVCTTLQPFRIAPGALGNGFNFWPDCSEYEKTYPLPGFTYPDGTQAEVFSAYDRSTVFTHYRWMKEYGIDGAFAQRFMVYVNKNYTAEHEFHLTNLDYQMQASNEFGRAICVMYDLVGMGAEEHLTPEYLLADLAELEAKYHFKDRSQGQKYYLYHNGKPLVALVSFAQAGMPYDMTQCRRCVELVQEAGYSVMIGVPTYWRTGGPDSPYTDALLAMITDLHPDVLMPWFVGRYDFDGTTPDTRYSSGRITSFDNFKSLITDDAQWCRAHGVDYAPNVWPGFDWSHQRPASVPYDRHGGDFMWKQAYHDIAVAGAKMIYVAMFDEIDEGTAIFKTLRKSDAPSNVPNPDYYVKFEGGTYTITESRNINTLEQILGTWNKADKWWKSSSELVPAFGGVEDEYRSDHYLWLTGQIGAMLRGDIPVTASRPER